MLEQLLQLDTRLFYWINGHHNVWLDCLMWGASQKLCWAVVIALVFALSTMLNDARRWWLVAMGVVLCFLFADQGSVHLFKNTVCRLRPCYALENVRMFQTTCGSPYGFISSHASNAFALVTLFWMRYFRAGGKVLTKVALWLMMCWALMSSYSRPYLGKHYPGDVLFGMLFGAVVGVGVWWICSTIEKKLMKDETK